MEIKAKSKCVCHDFWYIQKQSLQSCVRFEVFTAVTLKNADFWDVALCRSCVKTHSSLKSCLKISVFWEATPSNPLIITWHFRLIFLLTFRVEEQAKQSSLCYVLHAGFLLCLFFDPESGGDVSPKRRSTFNGLHGCISQKIDFFINTVMRTTNSAKFCLLFILKTDRHFQWWRMYLFPWISLSHI
jgi:hypothetical protein